MRLFIRKLDAETEPRVPALSHGKDESVIWRPRALVPEMISADGTGGAALAAAVLTEQFAVAMAKPSTWPLLTCGLGLVA